MSPSTPRKRVKHLLKELWELQKHDVPMTAATLVEVKYLLRSCRRSSCVEIKVPKPHANVIDPNAFKIPPDAVPRFVLCQLLDQRLIASRNYQDTIALPAVLSVIALLPPPDVSIRQLSHPTQFRWHCSRTHRTHIIFAYIGVKMKTKVYDVEELLNLKKLAAPDILAAAVVGRDNELGTSCLVVTTHMHPHATHSCGF